MVAFQVFVIGMLADLIGRATRATHEVQPAAGFTRDAEPTFPPAHRAEVTAPIGTAAPISAFPNQPTGVGS
jgi:hypothetical protein